MTYVAALNACVCDVDAISVAGGCQRCGSDEIVVNGACGCAPGQTKSAANVCVAVAGLGDPCDASAPCTDATYSYCAIKGGATAGTCTSSCASNTECGSAYTCATWESHPYCRTFEGVDASCASQDECTGDAQLCDTLYTHICYIAGCSLPADGCPRDKQCCEFPGTGIPNLCMGACP